MVTRPLNAVTESVSSSLNVELQTWKADGATAIKASGVRLFHADRGIPCRLHPAATQVVLTAERRWDA